MEKAQRLMAEQGIGGWSPSERTLKLNFFKGASLDDPAGRASGAGARAYATCCPW